MARKAYTLGFRVVLGLRHHCAGRCFFTFLSTAPPFTGRVPDRLFPRPAYSRTRARGCLLTRAFVTDPVGKYSLPAGLLLLTRSTRPPGLLVALQTREDGF